MYYDIHFANAVINVQWIQTINSQKETVKKEEYYITHRSTIGNQLYILKRAMVLASVISSTSITRFVDNMQKSQLL